MTFHPGDRVEHADNVRLGTITRTAADAHGQDCLVLWDGDVTTSWVGANMLHRTVDS